MTNWAVIENDIVTNIIVAESKEIAELVTGKEIMLCPNNVAIGCIKTDGILQPIKPFQSWIWDNELKEWKSSTPYPNDGNNYLWNESTLSWEEVVSE